MKGMRKISRGSYFEGAVRYVFSGDDKKRPEAVRLLGGSFGSDAKASTIIRQFEGISALKKSIKKAVWHNSLRLPKGEKVDDARWVEIGDAYMRKMGFSEAFPRIYVLHDDYEGQHIHIVASRVGADGSVFYGQNENLRSTQVIASLEKDFALTITKGVDLDDEGKIVMPDVKPLRKKEIEKAVRTGETPARVVLQEAVESALSGRPTTLKFMERLERAGVVVKASFKGEIFNGFAFEYGGLHFSASELGDKYKFSRLKRRIRYDEAGDYRALAERRSNGKDNPGSAERDSGPAPAGVGRSGAGDTTDRDGARELGAGAESDVGATLRDRPAHESDRSEPGFDEAIATVRRLSKPADRRRKAIEDEEKSRRRAKIAREKAEVEEAEYQLGMERLRKARLAKAKEVRSARLVLINIEPAGWRTWRARQMVKEYGAASQLLTLFFMKRDAKRREIAYEYGGARIVDRGPLITAEHGSYAEIDAMLELARLKGWTRVKARGNDEFKAEIIRQALLRGFEVGADQQDEALLRRVKAEVRAEMYPKHDDAPRPAAPAPRPI